MQRGDAQRSQTQRQSVARPGHGMAIDSLQSGRIAQLQAAAETSPRASRLAQIGARADKGPRVTAQHRIAGDLNNRPRAAAHRLELDRLAGDTGQREEAEQLLERQVAQRATGNAEPSRRGLPDHLKNGIEALSGIAMSSVRMRYNASQPAPLDALADTQGADIHVAPGQAQHLPHEARHVAQQAHGGVQPTVQMSAGVAVNDDAGLEHEADAMGVKALLHGASKSGRPAAELMAPDVSVNQVTQAFGIDDRQWDQVTDVTHLGATAYKAAAADGGAVVIKKSGQGKVEYVPGSEGPTQEALAAKVGEIPGFGVKTAKTEMILTARDEGQAILGKLRSLGGVAAQLAESLATTETFLVMELAPGETLARSGPAIASAGPERNASWFYGLGRLWVFDVLLHNTDRFEAGNWGNVIVGTDGRVYGIDQMAGMCASNQGTQLDMAKDYAEVNIAKAIDPAQRRSYSKEIFSSLSAQLGQPFSGMERAFISNFEAGMLDGLAEAGSVDPEQLEHKKAELPEFARTAANALGLGGTSQMLTILAGQIGHAKTARADLAIEMDLRSVHAQSIAVNLAPLAAIRAEILHALRDAAGRLMTEWYDTRKWFFEASKKEYWRKRNLKEMALFRYEEYCNLSSEFDAVAREPGHQQVLRNQIMKWQDGLVRLQSGFFELNSHFSHSDEIETRIETLQTAIQEELDRKTIPESF